MLPSNLLWDKDNDVNDERRAIDDEMLFLNKFIRKSKNFRLLNLDSISRPASKIKVKSNNELIVSRNYN